MAASQQVQYLKKGDKELAYLQHIPGASSGIMPSSSPSGQASSKDAHHAAAALPCPTTSSNQPAPGVMFCTGLLSNMQGGKAVELQRFAEQQGLSFLRFDYRGHGQSSGRFVDTSIKEWLEDGLDMLDQVAAGGKQVIVGSSMGGWIALHMALQRPERVAGLVLIAPAVDITARFWHQLGPQKQATLCAGSSVSLGSSFITDGSDALTIRFFEQGAQHFLFKNTEWDPSRSSSGSSEGDPAAGGSGAGKQLKQQAGSRPGDAGAADGGRKLDGIQCPVIILHGVLDDVVPVQVSRQLVQELPAAACVQLHEVLEGDHRLSRQEDLQLLSAAVSELLQACA